MKKTVLLLVGVVLSTLIFAQKGSIRGKVVDGKTGEGVFGVNVIVEGTTTGGSTDFDGNYIFDLAPGNYILIASAIGYETRKISDVVIKDGETTVADFTVSTEVYEVGDGEEAQVVASRVTNTKIAQMTIRKNSSVMQNSITAQEIADRGGSNSADAVKAITGASVEGGKYVVMRGLGDRYSISQLNGVILPSLDPYRNSTSLDLIPSSIIDNITTTKTFSPDQPGSFTGGNVNITTKALPDDFYFDFGTSFSFNPVSNLQDDFISDPINGSNDWLGYGKSSRELPGFLDEDARNQLTPVLYLDARRTGEAFAAERELFQNTSTGLSNQFVPEETTSLLNHGVSFAFGDRVKLFNKNFGYNVSLNYSRSFTNKKDWELNINRYGGVGSETLGADFNTVGLGSTDNPRLGGLVSFAYQIDNANQISLEQFYNHDAEITAGQLSGSWDAAISGPHEFFTNNISYKERTISSTQLKGRHQINEKMEFNWITGYANGSQLEPDTRIFAYFTRNDGDDYIMNDNELQLPFHFFRELRDVQYNAKADLEIPLGAPSTGNKIQVGGAFSLKERNFDELRFQMSFNGADEAGQFTSFAEADGDFDAFFSQDNAGIFGVDPNNPARNLLGYSYLSQSRPSNFYTGVERISAGYIMGTYNIGGNLKLVGGARVEQTFMEVESEDPGLEKGEINTTDILPSLNVIYSLTEESNLRASASQTLARPNMRELAPFNSVDFIGGFFFLGNAELERTLIQNLDLRYEIFPKKRLGELFAVSAFYKHFDKPIVKQLNPIASGGEILFVNVDEAYLFGAEFEYQKNLGFLSPMLENFNLATNLTYTYSRVDLTPEEFEAFSQVNPDIKDWRPFQAQSPYIVNVGVTYKSDSTGWEGGLYANAYGRRLAANGFGGAPDVYEIRGSRDSKIPTPDLNLTVRKRIGDNVSIAFKASNLLNAKFIRNQEFNDQLYNVEYYEIGTTYGLSLKYSI